MLPFSPDSSSIQTFLIWKKSTIKATMTWNRLDSIVLWFFDGNVVRISKLNVDVGDIFCKHFTMVFAPEINLFTKIYVPSSCPEKNHDTNRERDIKGAENRSLLLYMQVMSLKNLWMISLHCVRCVQNANHSHHLLKFLLSRNEDCLLYPCRAFGIAARYRGNQHNALNTHEDPAQDNITRYLRQWKFVCFIFILF